MPALPRDWYFPAGRARFYRRVATVIIYGGLVAGVIGTLLAGHLRLPAKDDGMAVDKRPAVASSPPPPAHYRNCRDARAAGAGSLRRGQPGYAQHLDADGDGIACEPLPRR